MWELRSLEGLEVEEFRGLNFGGLGFGVGLGLRCLGNNTTEPGRCKEV